MGKMGKRKALRALDANVPYHENIRQSTTSARTTGASRTTKADEGFIHDDKTRSKLTSTSKTPKISNRAGSNNSAHDRPPRPNGRRKKSGHVTMRRRKISGKAEAGSDSPLLLWKSPHRNSRSRPETERNTTSADDHPPKGANESGIGDTNDTNRSEQKRDQEKLNDSASNDNRDAPVHDGVAPTQQHYVAPACGYTAADDMDCSSSDDDPSSSTESVSTPVKARQILPTTEQPERNERTPADHANGKHPTGNDKSPIMEPAELLDPTGKKDVIVSSGTMSEGRGRRRRSKSNLFVSRDYLKKLRQQPADDEEVFQRLMLSETRTSQPSLLGCTVGGNRLRRSESLDGSDITMDIGKLGWNSKNATWKKAPNEPVQEVQKVQEMKHPDAMPCTRNRQEMITIGQGHVYSSGSNSSIEQWSVDDDSASGPIEFKVHGKRYVHPPLPPGWDISVSNTRQRPYYSHPDFGTTWYCPVVLPQRGCRTSHGDTAHEVNQYMQVAEADIMKLFYAEHDRTGLSPWFDRGSQKNTFEFEWSPVVESHDNDAVEVAHPRNEDHIQNHQAFPASTLNYRRADHAFQRIDHQVHFSEAYENRESVRNQGGNRPMEHMTEASQDKMGLLTHAFQEMDTNYRPSMPYRGLHDEDVSDPIVEERQENQFQGTSAKAPSWLGHSRFQANARFSAGGQRLLPMSSSQQLHDGNAKQVEKRFGSASTPCGPRTPARNSRHHALSTWSKTLSTGFRHHRGFRPLSMPRRTNITPKPYRSDHYQADREKGSVLSLKKQPMSAAAAAADANRRPVEFYQNVSANPEFGSNSKKCASPESSNPIPQQQEDPSSCEAETFDSEEYSPQAAPFGPSPEQASVSASPNASQSPTAGPGERDLPLSLVDLPEEEVVATTNHASRRRLPKPTPPVAVLRTASTPPLENHNGQQICPAPKATMANRRESRPSFRQARRSSSPGDATVHGSDDDWQSPVVKTPPISKGRAETDHTNNEDDRFPTPKQVASPVKPPRKSFVGLRCTDTNNGARYSPPHPEPALGDAVETPCHGEPPEDWISPNLSRINNSSDDSCSTTPHGKRATGVERMLISSATESNDNKKPSPAKAERKASDRCDTDAIEGSLQRWANDPSGSTKETSASTPVLLSETSPTCITDSDFRSDLPDGRSLHGGEVDNDSASPVCNPTNTIHIDDRTSMQADEEKDRGDDEGVDHDVESDQGFDHGQGLYDDQSVSDAIAALDADTISEGSPGGLNVDVTVGKSPNATNQGLNNSTVRLSSTKTRRFYGMSSRVLFPPHPLCSLQSLPSLLRKAKRRRRTLIRSKTKANVQTPRTRRRTSSVNKKKLLSRSRRRSRKKKRNLPVGSTILAS